MFEFFFNSKYGTFCRNIHFTDTCEENLNCGEKYCDKRHHMMCSYFEKYRRCKFGSYCAYSHMKPRKHKVELEVEKLKK